MVLALAIIVLFIGGMATKHAVDSLERRLKSVEAQTEGFNSVLDRSEFIINRIEREMQKRGWTPDATSNKPE